MERFFKINEKGLVEVLNTKKENLLRINYVDGRYLNPNHFLGLRTYWTILDCNDPIWDRFRSMYKPVLLNNYMEREDPESSIKLSGLEAQEKQIYKGRESISYTTREFTIEDLLSFIDGDVQETDEVIVWGDLMASPKVDSTKIIEELILGHPAEVLQFHETNGSPLTIYRGRSFLETLYKFFKNDYKLEGVETLTTLEGKSFFELSSSRRRKLLNVSIRCIVFSR